MTVNVHEDPRNAGLTYMGEPLRATSKFVEGCMVVQPALKIYEKCGHMFAYIRRSDSGPIMQRQEISASQVHTLT